MSELLEQDEHVEVNSQALLQLARESARSASESLGTWLNRPVEIETEGFDCVPLSQIGEIAGPADEAIIGVHMPLEGELTGHVLLALPEAEAVELVQMLVQSDPQDAAAFGELEESCIRETGNIVGSSFSNALARWLRMTTIPGVPMVMHDLAAAVVAPLLYGELAMRDEMYMTRTRFLVDGRSVDWRLILVFTDDVLERLRAHAEREQIINYELGQLFQYAANTTISRYDQCNGAAGQATVARFDRAAFSHIRTSWSESTITLYETELTSAPTNRLFIVADSSEMQAFDRSRGGVGVSAPEIISDMSREMARVFRGRLNANLLADPDPGASQTGVGGALLDALCDHHEAADHECFLAGVRITFGDIGFKADVHLAVHVDSYTRLGSIHL